MIKDSGFRLRTVALVACCGALLVGCGGGSSTVSEKKEMPDNPPGASTPATETKESRQTTQRTAITRASTTATAAVAEVDNDATDAQVTAADNAITALNTAIGNAEDLPPTELAAFRVTRDALTASLNKAKTSRTAAQTAATTAQTTESRRTTQRTAITRALTAAREAVAEVDNDATDAQVAAAENAISALNTAIGNAEEDLPEAELEDFKEDLGTLRGQLNTKKGSRSAAQTARDEQTQKAMEAAKDEAKKMFGAIFPFAAAGAVGNAAYSNDNTELQVTNRIDANNSPNPTAISLTEDKNAMLTGNYGWDAKKYTDKDADGNIIAEAVVYADLEKLYGLKFGSTEDNSEFKYQLPVAEDDPATTDEDETKLRLQADNSPVDFSADTAAEVRITQNIATSGTTTVEQNTPNPKRRYSGSYDGVAGTFICPTGPTACKAEPTETLQVFKLNNAWRFEVGSNKNQRISVPPDEDYASYGWWIYKHPGQDWTASAFHDYRGDSPSVSGFTFTGVTGTATYTGGATGWYALSSNTGGTNDSGNFTAKVNITANFGSATDPATIDGIINTFKGADGQSRDWTVQLQEITGVDNVSFPSSPSPTGNTVWTINNGVGDCTNKCQWSGSFHEPSVDTPDEAPSILTGNFYTEFGTEGKMVGSFGTKK